MADFIEDEKGALVPAVRFKGFTDEWVQRRLGEVSELNPRSILPTSFEYVDLESVVGTSLIAHRTENKDTAPSRAQRLAIKGDVFYQTVRPYQKNNLIFDIDSDNFVFSTGYAQLRPHIDSYFLFYKLQEEKFVTKVLDNCTGTSYPAINSTVLSQIEIDITLVKAEQTSIGNFFRTLDEIITLHKRKLDGFKELKKGYLQQMFPRAGEYVPWVRFAGFSGDWEPRKLGKVLKVNSGKDYKHLNKGNIPVYGTGGYMLNVDESLSEVDAVGIGRKGTIDKPQLLFAPFWTVDTLFFLTPLQDNVLLFMYALSQNIEWAKLDESTGVPSLSKVNIVNVDTFIPKTSEQTAIGNFFRSLDEQITTQQSKLDKLKQLKTAYLQRMFV